MQWVLFSCWLAGPVNHDDVVGSSNSLQRGSSVDVSCLHVSRDAPQRLAVATLGLGGGACG